MPRRRGCLRLEPGTGFAGQIRDSRQPKWLATGAASRPALIALAIVLSVALAGGATLHAQERALRILTFEGYTDDEWVDAFEIAHADLPELARADLRQGRGRPATP